MTPSEASDAILARFWAQWQADAPAQNGGDVPEVRWQGDDSGALPPSDAAWARVTLRHVSGRQRTLAPEGSRRFEHAGLVTVQVFAPLSLGRGLTQAQSLATIARDAFEGKTAGAAGEVWFRGATVREVGPDGPWYQMNAVAEFQYDEIK